MKISRDISLKLYCFVIKEFVRDDGVRIMDCPMVKFVMGYGVEDVDQYVYDLFGKGRGMIDIIGNADIQKIIDGVDLDKGKQMVPKEIEIRTPVMNKTQFVNGLMLAVDRYVVGDGDKEVVKGVIEKLKNTIIGS